MNISLTPALEEFVNAKVATGLYNSASEVIREALRLLVSKEKISVSKERIDMLNKDIQEGLEDRMLYDGIEVMDELIKKYEEKL